MRIGSGLIGEGLDAALGSVFDAADPGFGWEVAEVLVPLPVVLGAEDLVAVAVGAAPGLGVAGHVLPGCELAGSIIEWVKDDDLLEITRSFEHLVALFAPLPLGFRYWAAIASSLGTLLVRAK